MTRRWHWLIPGLVCACLYPLLAVFGFGAQEATQPQPNKKAQDWWSLKPVIRSTPPAVPARWQAWAANPIDAFILAKLEEKGLEPSPEADRRTLLRRLTFDLTGLPPTPEDIDTFLKDASPQAYERVVERLLASPHYGERWARHWMDIVHFAETHGHDQDVPRDHAWPYRDYLIDSFNRDKPYVRFVEEQIAGDVLYPKEPQAIVALGMLAAGPWDESSLRDIREDSIDRKAGQYLDRDDMIGTVGLTFLSTTIQCARCHNHKFDPISQKEYYGLQAVFAGVDRANRAYDADSETRASRESLMHRKKLLARGPAEVAKILAEPGVAERVAAWDKTHGPGGDWKVFVPIAYKSAGGATIKPQADGSLLFSGTRPEKDTYTIEGVTSVSPITVVRLEVLTDESLPLRGPGRRDNGNLHLNEFKVAAGPAAEPTKQSPIKLAGAFADFNQIDWEITKAIDGKPATAWGIYPEVGQPHSAVFVFKQPVQFEGGTHFTFTLEQTFGGGHLIGRPRISVSSAPAPKPRQPFPAAVERVLAKSKDQRNEKERLDLAAFAIGQLLSDDLAALPAPKLVYAAAAEFKADGSFKPFGTSRPVHVLRRGDINKPLELAQPGALSCVQGLDADLRLKNANDEGQRRAALAKWISDPRNPLTWRSIVNRVWHYHFGRGLVATPSDFGRMGATPTHPELLDWLTATFLEDGGSLKQLHRRIVTSAAYRQSYRTNAAAAKIDADNSLLWRANIRRLDAESIRDAVLLVSGQLDTKMGGPSVKHFKQSPGIHRTPKVDYAAYDPDTPGAHRRSVYRFLFRTVPDPFMDALDCPDASQFAAVRPVSITPLQALALLNDPFMVRMSEHLARSVEPAGDMQARVRLIYRFTLGREATEREATRLADYAEQHGLANACRVVLNSNEFVFVP